MEGTSDHPAWVGTKVVDFFLIGAQKSGTTTVSRHMENHPKIPVRQRKELLFFNGPWGVHTAKCAPSYASLERSASQPVSQSVSQAVSQSVSQSVSHRRRRYNRCQRHHHHRRRRRRRRHRHRDLADEPHSPAAATTTATTVWHHGTTAYSSLQVPQKHGAQVNHDAAR